MKKNLKMKKIKQRKDNGDGMEEIEVIDRSYYISEILKKEKEKNRLVIKVHGGMVEEVSNAPEDGYTIVDLDVITVMSEEEFMDWVYNF